MGIQRLPVELYRRVFLCLRATELVHAAHVCSRWWSLVFDNPAYWGDISITTITPSALDFAEHRMKHGGTRPLWFAIVHKQIPHQSRDDPVLKRVIPMLKAAVPRAWYLAITIESMYRLYVEDTLCQAAPNLRSFNIMYTAHPLPELPLLMPLGYRRKLFNGITCSLRSVHLFNIVLSATPTAAFLNVDEIWFIHALTTWQEEFPCYLLDFFPKATRLRMTGGNCMFTNAPLPVPFLKKFRVLKWVDLEFPHSSLPAFLQHLPLDDLDDLILSGPDEDHVYRTLEPLRSHFHLDFFQSSPNEFHMSLQGSSTHRVRRFAEPLKYYYPDSPDTNMLLYNDEFMDQVSTLSIHITLWDRLRPWLQSTYPVLPKLVLVLNEDTPFTVRMPSESISLPSLCTLVIQAAHHIAYVNSEDLIEFLRRITTQRVALELRRVFVTGNRELLTENFESVVYHATRAAICVPTCPIPG